MSEFQEALMQAQANQLREMDQANIAETAKMLREMENQIKAVTLAGIEKDKENLKILAEKEEERKKTSTNLKNQKDLNNKLHEKILLLREKPAVSDFFLFYKEMTSHKCEACEKNKIKERKHFLRIPVNIRYKYIERQVFGKDIISNVLVSEVNCCRQMSEFFFIIFNYIK